MQNGQSDKTVQPNIKFVDTDAPFFFQAEDGIRDLTVTGVQTCALPISSAHSRTVAKVPFPLYSESRKIIPNSATAAANFKSAGAFSKFPGASVTARSTNSLRSPSGFL